MSSRRKLVAGNWKMHGTRAHAWELVVALRAALGSVSAEVVICPPFTALTTVSEALAGSSIGLGAQDVHWAPEGAWTGEVSAAMLADVGCDYVLVGHSERRTHFGEDDARVRRKLDAAMARGLVPIVCIGETLDERERNLTESVLGRQLDAAFGSREFEAGKVIVAYEPVWAIGTGRSALPEQAQAAHAFIRERLATLGGPSALTTRVLYGGSVSADNAKALFSQPDVDGGLVGGASLDASAFAAIAQAAS